MKIRSYVLVLALAPLLAMGSLVKAENSSPTPMLHLAGDTSSNAESQPKAEEGSPKDVDTTERTADEGAPSTLPEGEKGMNDGKRLCRTVDGTTICH